MADKTQLCGLPAVARLPEETAWLNENALVPFVEEIHSERQAEVARVAEHVELSLTETLQRLDEEIGRAADEVDGGAAGAERRHADVLTRRERRREELERQGAVTLQGVEGLASALVLPHPESDVLDLRRLRPHPETEMTAMRVVKGLAAPGGSILLTPNERRVAEDRRDCYWLYVVTHCASTPELQEPIRDPACFPWREVTKVQHYWMDVKAMTGPMPAVGRDNPNGGSMT